MTSKKIGSRERAIQRILDAHRFAVLATQRDGQPHTSLVAFTPSNGIRQLVFATYRSTRKFRSLLASNRVSLLIGGQSPKPHEHCEGSVLTAHGMASVVLSGEKETLLREHRMRHPDLGVFLSSPEVAVISVVVTAYQLVGGIEDVRWFQLTDCNG